MRTELDPDEPAGHLELGWILLQYGRLEAADSALLRALEIEPGLETALFLRALIAQSWGEPERATREFARLFTRFPHADIIWAPLRAAVDTLVWRTHLTVAALFVVFALAVIASVDMPGDGILRRVVLGLGPLAVAAAAVGIRWLMVARRIGRTLVRSLVRMRVREATLVRWGLILDGAVAALFVVIALVPSAAWRPLVGVQLAALAVGTALFMFAPRETDDLADSPAD